MTAFDAHDKCAKCCAKCLRQDPSHGNNPCKICDGFTQTQRDMLSTPKYQIHKGRQVGVLNYMMIVGRYTQLNPSDFVLSKELKGMDQK